MDKFYIMLIGLPGSGKSTYLKELKQRLPDVKVISRDDVVMEFAKSNDLTYSESFLQFAEAIDKEFKNRVGLLREEEPNIIINDKTNLISTTRDREVLHFKERGYKIVYCFFEKPVSDVHRYIWKQRVLSRKGKDIPDSVLERMYADYCDYVPDDARVKPDTIEIINSWGK